MASHVEAMDFQHGLLSATVAWQYMITEHGPVYQTATGSETCQSYLILEAKNDQVWIVYR